MRGFKHCYLFPQISPRGNAYTPHLGSQCIRQIAVELRQLGRQTYGFLKLKESLVISSRDQHQ